MLQRLKDLIDQIVIKLKTIPTKVSELENDEEFAKESDLSLVAFTGKYNDLTGLPASSDVWGDYANISGLLLDQSNQGNQYIYLVEDASDDSNITFDPAETKLQAFYKYNGVATGSIDDYTLISAPYANQSADFQGITTTNSDDINLSGNGTTATPLEAELTQNVKDEIADKEDSSNKVQDLNNPNSTTYPSTQAIADLDLDDFKNESNDPFVRESEMSDIESDGIGTRNYLHNSDFSLPNPSENLIFSNNNSLSFFDGNALLTVNSVRSSNLYGIQNISINDIGEFTFSIKIKATTSVDRWIFSAGGLVGFTGPNKFIDVTGDWQVLTWNITNETPGGNKIIRLYLQNAEIGDTVEIEWVKLEKTNIHSDWTPSPEDQKEWANLRFLRYDTDSQNLTPTEQENARANLGLNMMPSVIALMHGDAEEDIYPVLPNLQWDVTIQSIVLVSRDTVTGSDLEARILVDDTPQQGADLIIPANSRASNEVNFIDWDAGQNIDLEVTQTGSTDAGSNLALYIFYSLRS